MNATTNTRTTAARRTATAKAAAPASEVHDVEEGASFSYMDFARSMASMAGVEIPSGKQLLVATVVGLAFGLLGGYAVGSLAAYVFAGAVLLTGSAFISFIAMALTFVIGVYLTSKATSKVAMYVATGQLGKDADRARGWVTSLFSSKKEVLA